MDTWNRQKIGVGRMQRTSGSVITEKKTEITKIREVRIVTTRCRTAQGSGR